MRSQPRQLVRAASSSAAAAVQPEHGEAAPVIEDILNDDVALLDDGAPIQAEPEELEGSERDLLDAIMTEHMVATTVAEAVRRKPAENRCMIACK